jgi:hypothetical protein
MRATIGDSLPANTRHAPWQASLITWKTAELRLLQRGGGAHFAAAD